MTHTPGLLRVREQSELDKTLKSVMLEDDAGEFVIVSDEKYGERIAALWNMAERLGLSTEDIEGITDSASLLYLSLEVMAKEKGGIANDPHTCGMQDLQTR